MNEKGENKLQLNSNAEHRNSNLELINIMLAYCSCILDTTHVNLCLELNLSMLLNNTRQTVSSADWRKPQ